MDYSAFMKYFNHHDNFSVLNGMKIIKMDEGYAEAIVDYRPDHNNFMGTLHGGAITTLTDITAGTSIISFGKQCVTLNASVNYLRPAKEGKVRAVATAINRSRQFGTTEVKVYDEDDNLICYCSYVMFITNIDASVYEGV